MAGQMSGVETDMNTEPAKSESLCSESSPESHKAREVRKNNVSDLVAKSKKAASSLWTLLHAKNCRMGANVCAHVGCPEAKLMYLHLKTCSAVLLEPCPGQHKGCQDARKLLAHYRRCRDIRARQAQNPATRSQQHVCLVCSLVARHAKFTLDRTTPSCRSNISKNGGTSSHFIPSLLLTEGSFDERSAQASSTDFGPSPDENRGFASTQPSLSSTSHKFSFSRPAIGGGSSRGFQALQAAVSCAIGTNPHSSTSPLDPIVEDSVIQDDAEKILPRRPRAESLDVRSSQVSPEGKQPEGAKSMSYLYLAAVESLEEEPRTPQSRRRSQSCSVPSVSVSSSIDPMLQKPMGEELQCIFGGDS